METMFKLLTQYDIWIFNMKRYLQDNKNIEQGRNFHHSVLNGLILHYIHRYDNIATEYVIKNLFLALLEHGEYAAIWELEGEKKS